MKSCELPANPGSVGPAHSRRAGIQVVDQLVQGAALASAIIPPPRRTSCRRSRGVLYGEKTETQLVMRTSLIIVRSLEPIYAPH